MISRLTAFATTFGTVVAIGAAASMTYASSIDRAIRPTSAATAAAAVQPAAKTVRVVQLERVVVVGKRL